MASRAGIQVFTGGDPKVAQLVLEHDGPASDVAALDALVALPDRQAERLGRLDALDDLPLGNNTLARAALAHRAWAATELGSLDADRCAALAREALAGDAPLGGAYLLAVRALVLTDRHDEARSAIAALRAGAEARGSLPLRAAAAWQAGELALRTGDLPTAEREARAALDLARDHLRPVTDGAADVLARALIERGALAEAEAVFDERDRHGLARARLHLARGDYERAHALAAEPSGHSEWTPWRATAALALAHLGRRDEAAVLADDEVHRAKRFGAPTPLAAALHARAVAEPDDAVRIELCLRALRALDGVTAVLDATRIRLELGDALARSGARARARDALRPALADADAVGADPLADRARRALVATGIRPRRAALEGLDSLTPRQHEICALALDGRGNREIAAALFLSIKTVETHLAAAYRKLGIRSRAELGVALAV
jgi:DNA-binding CsgD family transcriptional regulator